MASQFRKVGEAPFPAGKGDVKCDVFEWKPPASNLIGKFTVRFLSPQEEPPRVYFLEPILKGWLKDKPSRFLENACAYGYKILARLDPHSAPDGKLFRILHALFRNRNEGHTRAGRMFQSAADFVVISPGGEMEVIVPGLDLGLDREERTSPRGRDDTFCHRAEELLRSALEKTGIPPPGNRCGFPEVVAAYEAMLLTNREIKPAVVNAGGYEFALNTLGLRGDIDLRFTEGVAGRSTRFDWVGAITKIRTALIHGPVSKKDFALALKYKSLQRPFFRHLGEATNTKTPCEFDRWMKNVREHRYLTLVGGSRLKGRAREKAIIRAQRLYCALTWLAYEQMARCYGALMLDIYGHFCLRKDPEPSLEERWLFGQWHLPQLYLAGLPLDFLGRSQIRWVFRKLRKFWYGGVYDPDPYDEVTDLLGLFGTLVQDRREADRAWKKRPPVQYHLTADPQSPPDEGVEEDTGVQGVGEQETVRALESRHCPRCGEILQIGEIKDMTDRSRAVVRLDCPECYLDRLFWLNLDDLPPDLRPTT